MVRLIIPTGEDFTFSASGSPITIEGPLEVVFEEWTISGVEVSSGEFIRAGGQWAQTLPYLREELSIALPVCLTLALLIALTWLRRWV